MKRERCLAILAVVGLVLTSCGLSDDAAHHKAAEPSAKASPFVVTKPPEGFRLAAMGEGTIDPTWASDNDGPSEPFTLFSSDGTINGDLLAVGFTVDESDADEMYDVLTDGLPGTDQEPRLLDDGDTVYASKGQIADLRVRRGKAIWVRVSSNPPKPESELLDLANQVPIPDRGSEAWNEVPPPPDLPDHWAGYQRLGSADGTLAAALYVWMAYPPGSFAPTGTFVQEWMANGGDASDPDPGAVIVRTIPGRSADMDVIGRHPWRRPQVVGESESQGRRVLRLRVCWREDYCSSSVVAESSWGDLIVASSRDVKTETLAEVALSVERSDDRRWRGEIEELFGGPGLAPERGAEEVEQGTADGVDWLLQTVPNTREPDFDGASSGPNGEMIKTGIEVEYGIDKCIRLSDLTRACAGGGRSSSTGSDGTTYTIAPMVRTEAAGPKYPVITVVALAGYPETAKALHIVGPAFPADGDRPARPGVDVTVPLVDAPGGYRNDGRFAVVEGVVGIGNCGPIGDSGDPVMDELGKNIVQARVSLVNDAGEEVACLGLG